MKKSNLRNLIHEAILEVLEEDMAADNAAKTAELNALKLKQVALAKKAAELSKSNLGEMARTPLLFKVADDYDEAMLKALPKQSDKIMFCSSSSKMITVFVYSDCKL